MAGIVRGGPIPGGQAAPPVVRLDDQAVEACSTSELQTALNNNTKKDSWGDYDD